MEEGSVVLELVVPLVVKEVSLEEELVVLLEESLEVLLSSPKLTRQELMMRVRSNKLDRVRAFFIISTSVDTTILYNFALSLRRKMQDDIALLQIICRN